MAEAEAIRNISKNPVSGTTSPAGVPVQNPLSRRGRESPLDLDLSTDERDRRSVIPQKKDNKGKTDVSNAPNALVRITRILTLVFLVLLAGFSALIILTRDKTAENESQNQKEPTPTVGQYQQYIPSIYADDEVVLKLEENINILKNEIATTPLKDTNLIPPSLDFKISF